MRVKVVAPTVLVLAACHASTVAPQDHAPPAAPFTDGLVEIGGGISLHLHCVGAGSPTVVLESGLGNDGSIWGDVFTDIGHVTRACVSDRAGLGYSSRPAPRPHTNRQMARELHTLLERAHIDGPYVLVGHSLGGVNVRLFASEHLDQVAGVVLVDSVSDNQPSRFWTLQTDKEMAEFRAGVAKLPEGLDLDTFIAGIADMHASSTSLGDRPLVVLTHGKDDAPAGAPAEQSANMARVWKEMQAELPRLSTNSVQVIAERSGHFIQLDSPALVVAAVREVVEASRAHGRVSASPLASLAHPTTP